MSHPEDIIRLYSTILFDDFRRSIFSDEDMKVAMGHMERVYSPDPEILSSTVRRLADYNSMAYRCAYLHKYAPFHTAMVNDIMRHILQQNDSMFRVFQKQFTSQDKFQVCSLGGGPGSDIVGALSAMFQHFGLFHCTAKVIDIKPNWKYTFSSVIRELGSGVYGPVGEGFTQRFFNWDYLTADLLEEVQDDVKSAIGSAELVTLIKFVSAAACKNTEWMLRKVFTLMKLGAVVLFIDNASGGFRQIVAKAATDCNLTSVCGPINHQTYTNEAFKITHWNRTSCYSTTVTVHMLQKLHPSPPFNIPPEKMYFLAQKSDENFSTQKSSKKISRRDKYSELEAENRTLQAKLKKVQEKSLKDLKEFTLKIVKLEKTISANKEEMKKLTETIKTLEMYKADVADCKMEVITAKEEIINLKKELENAKSLEHSALCESQKKVTEIDDKMTELVAARKRDLALTEQLQHAQKLLGAEIMKMDVNLQKMEEQENAPQIKPGSSLTIPEEACSHKKPLNAIADPKKTKPKQTQSVNKKPSLRLTQSRKRLFALAVARKTMPKRSKFVNSMSTLRVTRRHKHSDGESKKVELKF